MNAEKEKKNAVQYIAYVMYVEVLTSNRTTQYCTLSNKRCPSEHSILMNNQALPRSHSFKLLGVSIAENMIWHEHVSSIATAAGKKLVFLFRARKYFSPSNLLTLYKAQIRPSLEYCSYIWGAAAPTTLSILNAVQRRAIRLIGDPALTCHLQPLSHRRAVAAEVEFLLKLHKDKPMHGIFYKHLEEHGLSRQLTFSFLRSSGLKSEIEAFIMACQDGVFNTLVYRSM
nr:unnamed protein product [Callosobruchus chinensis]